MKRKLSRDSVGIQLTRDIFLLVLPFYLIVLMIVMMLGRNVKKELLETYEHELNVYMTQLTDQLMSLDKKLLEAGKSVEYQDFTAMERHQFWEKLQNIRQENSAADFTYGKLKEDGSLLFSVNEQALSYDEIMGLQEAITENKAFSGSSFYRMVWIKDTCYLWRQIEYSSCQTGCFCSVETILSAVEGEDFCVYMKKENSNEISLKEAAGFPLDDKKHKLILNGQKDTFYQTSALSENYGLMVVRLIPESIINSGYPFLGRILILLGVFSIVLVPVLLIRVRKLVITPLEELEGAMHQIEEQNFTYQMETKARTREFRYIKQVFNHMVYQINTLTIEAYKKELERLRIEENNLRLQINPHMLLNSFNMICSLACSKNYALIQKFSGYLMKYFQYALKKNDRFVTLGQELEVVQNYVEIQKIRFQDMFTCVYVVDEDLKECLIPPLLIQNFVENAIKYGLTGNGDTEVIIVAMADEDRLRLAVCDTGVGMDEKILCQIHKDKAVEKDDERKHIGIWNCRRRLKFYYGEKAEFAIASQKEEGTQVWMRIPLEFKEEGNHEASDC